MNGDTQARRGRLLGEGAVIVVSILLAFGIEAAWAQRQSRSEEEDALVSLDAEFSANLDQIDQVLGAYIAARESIEALVRHTPDEIRSLPQIRVSEIMLAASYLLTFDPVMGTTDALVGAGRLGVLRDSRLREALTTFGNLAADAAEEVGFLMPFSEAIWLAEIRHGGPWTDPATEIGSHLRPIRTLDHIKKATAGDLLRVRADPDFMGLVNRFHLNAGYYVVELEALREQIELILELVSEST